MMLHPQKPSSVGRDVVDIHQQTKCDCIVNVCGSKHCTCSGVARIFFTEARHYCKSCRARAECGNLLLGVVTERAIVGILPSSLPAATCHHDFRHVCGFYVRPRLHDRKIYYEAVASVALMVATPLLVLLLASVLNT